MNNNNTQDNTTNIANVKNRVLSKINPNNKNYDFITKIFAELEKNQNKNY